MFEFLKHVYRRPYHCTIFQTYVEVVGYDLKEGSWTLTLMKTGSVSARLLISPIEPVTGDGSNLDPPSSQPLTLRQETAISLFLDRILLRRLRS